MGGDSEEGAARRAGHWLVPGKVALAGGPMAGGVSTAPSWGPSCRNGKYLWTHGGKVEEEDWGIETQQS